MSDECGQADDRDPFCKGPCVSLGDVGELCK